MNQYNRFSESIANNTPYTTEQLSYPDFADYKYPMNSAISLPTYGETIELKGVQLLTVKNKMQLAISALDVEYETWIGNGEMSSTLDVFIMQFYQLQLIMEQYHAILNKDLGSIKTIADAMIETDANMASVWSNQ